MFHSIRYIFLSFFFPSIDEHKTSVQKGVKTYKKMSQNLRRPRQEEDSPPSYESITGTGRQPKRSKTFHTTKTKFDSFEKFLDAVCAIVVDFSYDEECVCYTVYDNLDEFKTFYMNDCPLQEQPSWDRNKKYYLFRYLPNRCQIFRQESKEKLLEQVKNMEFHCFANMIQAFLCCYYHRQFHPEEDSI